MVKKNECHRIVVKKPEALFLVKLNGRAEKHVRGKVQDVDNSNPLGSKLLLCLGHGGLRL